MIRSEATAHPAHWKHQPRPIAGRRALITGGTTGIGRSTALLLAHAGAQVLIFGRHDAPLNEALADLRTCHAHVFGLTADVTQSDDLDRVFDHADDAMGGLDILINNAGVGARSILDTSPTDARYALEVDLLGPIACAQRAVPRMRAAGGGDIINIGSLGAREQGAGADIYVAAKAGLRGFSTSLGKQLAPQDIRVTHIEPGRVGADLIDESPEQQRVMHERGELLFSEDIAEAVRWCLTRPAGAAVPLLQIHPTRQVIGG